MEVPEVQAATGENIDPIRNQIVRDLRILRSFERARERADSLVGCFPGESLEEAYELDDELLALKDTIGGSGSGLFKPAPFPRMSRYDAARGRVRDTTYIAGGVGSVPNDVIDLCFELGDDGEVVSVAELPARAAVLAIQWIKTDPPDQIRFDEIRQPLTDDLTRRRAATAVADWLAPEKIRARTEFVFAEGFGL